jgi:hypothetical protein
MVSETMKAVVFKGPGKVVIEDRPVPKIKDQTDIIVKVDKVPNELHAVLPELTPVRLLYVEGTSTSSTNNHTPNEHL